MSNRIQELQNLGQSVWFDYIRRAFIASGELQALLDAGVTGVTSNPSIFKKAIAGSSDYDKALQPLIAEGKSVEEMYETLALEDIAQAADLLRPIYDRTKGTDGYVSLEVSPDLAHDTPGTIHEARRLFSALHRPNVMIKVPATEAGIPAIATLIGERININVTLIFSLRHYEAVAEAYFHGLETLAAGGGDLSSVASVASFFISRVDTAVDRALEQAGNSRLQGKIAIANAKVAYAYFQKTLRGERWDRLSQKGARPQRVLWASTSTKNPAYPDTLYVDAMIGPLTVNTIPPATLQAFRDHGTVAETLTAGVAEARSQLNELAEPGIDLDRITQDLQDAGVASFAGAFVSLMESIREKQNRLKAEKKHYEARLGSYQPAVDSALAEMKSKSIMRRIWEHDYTVWQPDPEEITNRLGWLRIAEEMAGQVSPLNALADTLRKEGYSQALLLGMGGSSLAPEVFRKTFGVRDGYLDLAVLDSTDPDAVLHHASRLDMATTLFIVATKSGGTTETLSFFKYFYNRMAAAVGEDRAGEHFLAITDPGSQLVELANRYHFRATFLNNPNIGGRYSALSYFGLVPAALVGVDLAVLLDRVQTMVCNAESCNCPVDGDNQSAWLGATLGELARAGRDKVTLVVSPEIASFGDWVEQLIAESTGKDGKGILPVVGEALGDPGVYGDDRLFAALTLDGKTPQETALNALETAGHPVIRLHLRDKYDLGAQFFLWEMATAVAGYRLGIHPFNQPNVEAAKIQARNLVAAYRESGRLPQAESVPLSRGALDNFLSAAQPGDYIAIQAYLPPTPETTRLLQSFRLQLRDQTHLATTLGYGPRFLHSTGQMHKGDAGNGLFIQITSESQTEVAIPDEAGKPGSSISFGVLKLAQALGDYQALLEARPPRRVIRFHVKGSVEAALQRLVV